MTELRFDFDTIHAILGIYIIYIERVGIYTYIIALYIGVSLQRQIWLN